MRDWFGIPSQWHPDVSKLFGRGPQPTDHPNLMNSFIAEHAQGGTLSDHKLLLTYIAFKALWSDPFIFIYSLRS